MSIMSNRINELKEIFCKQIDENNNRKMTTLKAWDVNNALNIIANRLNNISLSDYELIATFPKNVISNISRFLARNEGVTNFETREMKTTEKGIIPASLTIKVYGEYKNQKATFIDDIKNQNLSMQIPFYKNRAGYITDLSDYKNFEKLIKELQAGENPIIGYETRGYNEVATPIHYSKINLLMLPNGEEIDKNVFEQCISFADANHQQGELFMEVVAAQRFLNGLMYCPEKQMLESAEQICILYQIGLSENSQELMDASCFCMKTLSTGVGDVRDQYIQPSVYDVLEKVEEEGVDGPYYLNSVDKDGNIIISYHVNIETNDIYLDNTETSEENIETDEKEEDVEI